MSEKKHFPILIFLLGMFCGIILYHLTFITKTKKLLSFIYPSPTPTPALIKPKAKIVKKKNQRFLKIPIIMYHYVEYVKDQGDTIRRSLSLTPFTFEQQLIALQNNHYQTLFVKDVPKVFKNQEHYSTKSAVLTFDDGYLDFYEIVFPLLKKYQAKVTLFIIYNFIGRSDFLNREQINEMINSGLVEVGAHTLNHAYLTGIAYERAETEIVESKTELEQDFAIKVESFAYPYGAYDPQAEKIVKKAGFTAAVSTDPGAIQDRLNIFALKRLRSGMVASPNIVNILENYNR